MNCDIIKDLVPLYIDGCCSEESRKTVKEHIESCKNCKQIFDGMNYPSDIISAKKVTMPLKKIDTWRASILQSVLLFVAFGLITIGVAFEAKTPSGFTNGVWALNLVVPVTGFMLSLANWYFVHLYKNKKFFSNCSLFVTLTITVCSYVWTYFHYEINLFGLLNTNSLSGFSDTLQGIMFFFGKGFILTLILGILSKFLSRKYADLLGKI